MTSSPPRYCVFSLTELFIHSLISTTGQDMSCVLIDVLPTPSQKIRPLPLDKLAADPCESKNLFVCSVTQIFQSWQHQLFSRVPIAITGGRLHVFTYVYFLFPCMYFSLYCISRYGTYRYQCLTGAVLFLRCYISNISIFVIT